MIKILVSIPEEIEYGEQESEELQKEEKQTDKKIIIIKHKENDQSSFELESLLAINRTETINYMFSSSFSSPFKQTNIIFDSYSWNLFKIVGLGFWITFVEVITFLIVEEITYKANINKLYWVYTISIHLPNFLTATCILFYLNYSSKPIIRTLCCIITCIWMFLISFSWMIFILAKINIYYLLHQSILHNASITHFTENKIPEITSNALYFNHTDSATLISDLQTEYSYNYDYELNSNSNTIICCAPLIPNLRKYINNYTDNDNSIESYPLWFASYSKCDDSFQFNHYGMDLNNSDLVIQDFLSFQNKYSKQDVIKCVDQFYDSSKNTFSFPSPPHSSFPNQIKILMNVDLEKDLEKLKATRNYVLVFIFLFSYIYWLIFLLFFLYFNSSFSA